MEYLDLLQKIVDVCIIPLLGLLTTYLIQFINCKKEELKSKTNNETTKKYLDMLDTTIESCVIATNQTYVSALKDKNAFDLDAQSEAFQLTFDAVVSILSEEARKYLEAIYEDLDLYIINKIEAEVNKNKEVKCE